MVNLERLYLNANQLSGFLPFFGNLVTLVVLNVAGNNISGEIPDMFALMADLRVLRLDENSFTGVIPDSVGELKNARVVKFNTNFNEATGEGGLIGPLPASLGGLDSVQILELYDNLIDGEIPVELGNLQSLVLLDLQMNFLVGAVPDSFANLINLVSFYVSNNDLTGPWPLGMCDIETVDIMVPDCNLQCPVECCDSCVNA
jgi:Leucine-rich repeat (LRR) protein